MRIRFPVGLLTTILVSWVAATAPANAITSTATFVSRSGNDANANSTNLCAISTPCKTLNAALPFTSPGGVLACLDSTFNFGVLIINADVTIDCSETYGTIFGSFQGGIQINTTGKVVLRGLTIYSSSGFSGPVGIDVLQNAVLSVEKCRIFGFQTGTGSGAGIYIESAAQVEVRDSVIESNLGAGVGVVASSGDVKLKIQDSSILGNAAGIVLKPSGGATVEAAIERVHDDKNIGGGLRADGTGGGAVTVTVADSSFSLNGANGLVANSGPSGNVAMNVTHSLIASNVLAGVDANQASGGAAVVTVGLSTLANNGQAWDIVAGATLLSFQNNQVTGPTGTPPSQAFFQ